MSEVVPWFSRRRTPGDLETKVLNSSGSRCKFLDENGEDIRFKEPGFRWGMFKEMRKEVYKDYAERIQAVFDEVYEKITRIKRENETSQSPIPVLPTIKTPAISKTRSRVAAAGVKPPTQHLSPKRETPVISQPSFNTPSPSTTKSTKVPETVENPPEVVILDVTNTTVRRSMRLNKKDVPTKPSDNRLKAPHQQQADIELKPADVQPPESTSARPTRNTRSRAAKAASSSNAGPDAKAEPVRRSTRATSRRAAAKAAQKRIEDSFVEISEEPGDACTTKANVEEGEPELAEGKGSGKNEKPKSESISLQQVKMSVCKVSLEKVASPVTTPPVAEATPPPPPPPSEETDGKEEESTVNSKDEQPETMEASSSSHEVITIDGDEEEEGSDVAAVAPPPKRSLSVKPKRKVKGRGGKKGGARKGRKGATAAARRVTPIPILEEKEDEGTAEPMEEDNNGGASGTATHSSTSSSPSQQRQQGSLPTSSSSETVYESCVSQQSPVRVSPLTSTGSDATPRNSPSITCEEHDNESLDTHGMESKENATVVKKPTSRIPVLQLVKSPLPSQRFSSGSLKSPMPASPLLTSPCPATSPMTLSLETEAPPLATTHVKKSRREKKENIGTNTTSINKSKKQLVDSPRTKEMPSSLINRDSPAGPMNATYRVSPVSVPYLSKGHTPKTIRQLQEKLRSQTKGKLISLEELRNASPLFKKLSAKRKAAAAPSTVIKDGSSVLSPSKIPRLSPSSPLGSGIKRLRSVSLERLSSDHMTNPKRKSGSESSSGEAVIIGDDDGSPVLPTTPAANSANTRSSMSDFDDDSSTPLPPSSAEKEEEGAESSQEEDIMSVSTASSLGEELSDTPTPHSQEGACPYSGAKTGSSSKLGGKGNSTKTDFLKAMFSKKHNFTKEDIAKKAPAVTSLIPVKNSPRKMETRETRQEKLAEKVQRKREEEERRREELKAKKLQEIEEKKRKREAKAKKVAENQAALKEQEQEKKNRLKGQAKDDPVQKLNQKRAREVREKQRKHREKAQAAETKRREEEEAAKKRAQQIEEEWRIVTELASKRKEIEEEEKRQKRLDKQKEREQKKKQRELEEEKKQQAAAVTTATETAAASRKPPTATRASGNVVLKKMVVDDPKKRMEELLTGAITKVRAPTPVGKGRGGGSGCGSSGEEAYPGSGGKSNGFLKQFYGVVNDSGTKSTSSTAKTKSKKIPATATTTTSSAMSSSKLKPIQENDCIVIDDTSQSESDDDEYSTPLKDITSALNSTFTKEESSIENSTAAKEKGEHTTAKGVENHPNSNITTTTVGASSCTPTHNSHFHLMAGSALAGTLAAKSHEANGPQSYAMTPADRDPLYVYENYDIANLSSEDSTDDEECPRKVIPQWAGSHALNSFMLDQEAALEANCIDIAKIFPPEQLLKDIDLARIFKFKRKRFFQRSSSAHWNSPLYKKNRFEI